jgi:hypothetical protein
MIRSREARLPRDRQVPNRGGGGFCDAGAHERLACAQMVEIEPAGDDGRHLAQRLAGELTSDPKEVERALRSG